MTPVLCTLYNDRIFRSGECRASASQIAKLVDRAAETLRLGDSLVNGDPSYSFDSCQAFEEINIFHSPLKILSGHLRTSLLSLCRWQGRWI